MKSMLRTAVFVATAITFHAPCRAAADSPVKEPSLRSGFLELRTGNPAIAKEIFQQAAKHEAIADWGKLGAALAERKLGNDPSAIALLASIEESSAASLDAEVLKFSIAAKNKLDTQVFASLRSRVLDLQRDDLLQELLLVGVEDALRRESAREAYGLFRELRPLLSRPPSLTKDEIIHSDELFERIFKELPATEKQDALLFEAQHTFPERNLERTLILLERRKSIESPNSTAIVLEAKVLRADGNFDKARRLLEQFTQRKQSTAGEVVFLELIRMLWNHEELAAARGHAARYLKRFPKGELADEVRHIAALTWIDEGKYSEGIRALELLARSDSKSEFHSLAERDLAWIALRRRNFAESAAWLKRYRESAKRRFQAALQIEQEPERAKLLRDARFEMEHATFWLAEVCSRSVENTREICTDEPQQLWKSLMAEPPLSYYAMLAADRLKQEYPTPDLVAAAAQPTAQQTKACPSPEVRLQKSLTALRDQGLWELMRYELNWFLGRSFGTRGNPSSQSMKSESALGSASCRISLFLEFENSTPAIRLSEGIIRSSEAAGGSISIALLQKHLGSLLRALYPIPFRTVFEQATSADRVPLAFALAISRTESHFDPSARSSSDARGIMQLLPKTARAEGLADPERLFDFETNIKVGVQHLARLLAVFQRNEDLAAGAYNAGQEAVVRWRSRSTGGAGSRTDFENLGMDAWIETIPYAETRNYIKKVRLARRWYSKIHGSLRSPD